MREIELLTDARVTVLSERRSHGPYGLEGGAPGTPGANWIVRSGQLQEMPAKFQSDLSGGDVVGIRTPGGGGFGNPEAPQASEDQEREGSP